MSDPTQYLSVANQLRPNPGQWAAYESAGNCVLLAGPGSGKTKTLTLKLAKMLSEDVPHPRGVACITYNNECARELENRLAALGVEAGRRVFIGTVHSFSLTQIILPYAKTANLGLPDGFAIASRRERVAALENAYREVIDGPGNPQHMEFSMSRYRRSILDRDSEAWLARDPELAALVEAYERELRNMGRIDFDDMPLIGLRALRANPWLQEALLAKYPVLAVDEYQDLGMALHAMVLRLCFRAGMRLFAVGDADQSIYGFTGARPELLRQLSERRDVETVRLRLNYRCGSRIVTASSYALGEVRDYEAHGSTGLGTIFFHALTGDYRAYAHHLFTTIFPDIASRLPDLQAGNIAILYAAAWIGDQVAEVAQAYDIPTIRTDGNAIYPRGSRLMRWLETCAVWCCGGWRTGEPRFKRIGSEGSRLFGEAFPDTVARELFQRETMEFLWNNRNEADHLYDWLLRIYRDLLSSPLSNCPMLNDEQEMLTDFIERCSPSGDCTTMTLAQFAGQGSGTDCINLSTLHSSKGREFSVIILFGMDEGRVPRQNASAADIIEARRLFYVGFTRAKAEVHIVSNAYRPSRFVTEVQERLAE